jgi:hypothetical protein
MILPDAEAGTLHAKRRVAESPDLRSKNRMTVVAMMTQEVNRSGIIRLTFTA